MSHQSRSLDSHRVVVLLGGASAERGISLQSGAAVAAALEGRGHLVRRIDPAETELSSIDWPRFDAVFLALHGRYGEDGQIQSQFDSWGVPYTGSDAVASRLAFSKSAAKERFNACGVPTPPYVLIHEADSMAELRQGAELIGYPAVMKPDASGSSLGVSLISRPDELAAAAHACFAQGPFGLIERAILGTEWTLGLIDDERFPLIQIEPARPFYDYRAKYDDERTGYRFDAEFPVGTTQRIETAAADAAAAIGTRGIARVDLRLDDAGQPWVLEVNTVPGFTDHSLVPKAAAEIGLTLADLCEQALDCCLTAYHERRQNAHNTALRQEREPLRHAG